MTQEALFPLSQKDETKTFAAKMLMEKCAKTKTIILTDEGRVLTVTPTRAKTLCQMKPEWVYPVTSLQEASDIISKSYQLRNG